MEEYYQSNLETKYEILVVKSTRLRQMAAVEPKTWIAKLWSVWAMWWGSYRPTTDPFHQLRGDHGSIRVCIWGIVAVSSNCEKPSINTANAANSFIKNMRSGMEVTKWDGCEMTQVISLPSHLSHTMSMLCVVWSLRSALSKTGRPPGFTSDTVLLRCY